MSARQANRTFGALATAIFMIACGSSTTNNKTDAPNNGSGKHDAPSGGGSDAPGSAACSAEASYSPTQSGNAVAINEGSDTQDNPPFFLQSLLYQDALSASPEVFISVEIFGDGGSANTPDWPAALGPASGIDLSQVPDAGVLIGANVGSDGQAGDLYFATSGTMNVTAASATTGQTFSGTTTDLVLVHGSFNQTSGAFEPDPDGCQSTISSLAWSAKTAAPQIHPTVDGPSNDKISQALHRYLVSRHQQ